MFSNPAFSDTLETNESLREELDDIVGGLQTYLAQVQTKAAKKEKEFDQVLRQNEDLQDKLRKMEGELGVMDQEASSMRELERVRTYCVEDVYVQIEIV